jgi:hypothetical protein
MSFRGTTSSARMWGTVTYTHAASQQRLAAVVGRDLSARELVGLTGARSGAQVEVRGVYLTAKWEHNGHRYESSVIASRREPGDFTESAARGEVGRVTIANFGFTKDGNPGAPLEAAVLARQIPVARSLGVQVITMKGRSGSDDWERLPRLGFNAPIDTYLRAELRGGQLAQLPPGVHGPTLRDVLGTEAGRLWWHDQGEIHPTLFFNTSKGSRDVRILNAYIRAGGQ